MSRSITIAPGQKFVYKLEIYQIFEPQNYQDRYEGKERVRLDEPLLVKIGWYPTATAARNYGSYACGTAKWYGNKGKPEHWDYQKRAYVPVDRGREPDRDYKVFKIPVTLDMGEAVELPPLKRLHEVE